MGMTALDFPEQTCLHDEGVMQRGLVEDLTTDIQHIRLVLQHR